MKEYLPKYKTNRSVDTHIVKTNKKTSQYKHKKDINKHNKKYIHKYIHHHLKLGKKYVDD